MTFKVVIDSSFFVPFAVILVDMACPFLKKIPCHKGYIKQMKGGENMNKKQTSKSVATKASQILRDGRYSSKSKSVAGSALAQTKTGKKK